MYKIIHPFPNGCPPFSLFDGYGMYTYGLGEISGSIAGTGVYHQQGISGTLKW